MNDAEKLTEIRRLLAEAYKHYFDTGDGHCKSSEGAISINYPPFFWDDDNAAEKPSISIYAYVLGPNRDHYFRSFDEALTTVRRWHAEEMATDHEANEAEMETAMILWAEDENQDGVAS